MTDVTKKNVDAFKRLKAGGISGFADSASTPDDTPWVADDFIKEVTGYKKYKRASHKDLIGHCMKFWAWYGGAENAPENLDALMHGILSPVKNGEYYILHEDLIGTEDNTPEACTKTKVEKYEFYSVGTALPKPSGFSLQPGSAVSAVSCMEWINAILGALGEEHLATDVQKHQKLINLSRLTALVFLNCCRLATKDPQQVQEHIASTVVSRASTLFSITMSKYYTCSAFAVPSYSFMTSFIEMIRKGSATSKRIMGHLIYSYVHAENNAEAIKSVYRTGCLLSLSYTGLAPVSWLVKASKKKNLTQLDLLEKLYIPKMESFITKYLELEKEKDRSWVFCRLVSDTALLRLSAANEPLATAVFVALCYNPRAPDLTVWEIPSLSCISYEDVVRAHCISEALMEPPEVLAEQQALTDEAKMLSDRLKDSAVESYKFHREAFRTVFHRGAPTIGPAPPKKNEEADESDDENPDGGTAAEEGGNETAPSGRDDDLFARFG